jgi:hypothetical protein
MKISELNPNTSEVIKRVLDELSRHPVRPHKRALPIKLGRNKSPILINPKISDTENKLGSDPNAAETLRKKVSKSETVTERLTLEKLRSLLEMPATNEADIFQHLLQRGIHKVGHAIGHALFGGSRQTSQGSRSPKGTVGRVGSISANKRQSFLRNANTNATGPKLSAPPSPWGARPTTGGTAKERQAAKNAAASHIQHSDMVKRAAGYGFAKSEWKKEWGPEGTKTKGLPKSTAQMNAKELSDYYKKNTQNNTSQPNNTVHGSSDKPSQMSVYNLRKMRKDNPNLSVASGKGGKLGYIGGRLTKGF